MALYPLTAYRAALLAARTALESLKQHGHQREAVSHMLTRAELYELLGYTDYEARDRAYFVG